MKTIVMSCAFAVAMFAAWAGASILGHNLEARGAVTQSSSIDIGRMTRDARNLPVESFDAQ